MPNIQVQLQSEDHFGYFYGVGSPPTTNSNGEYELLLKNGDKASIIWVVTTTPYDSTQLCWQVLPYRFPIQENPTFEMFPSGSDYFSVTETVWSQLPADIFAYKAFLNGQLKAQKSDTVYVPNFFRGPNRANGLNHTVEF